MDCSLYQAARNGDINFLQNRADISRIVSQAETIQKKDNLLHIAANFKQLAFAKEIIRLNSSLLTRANSKGDVPLHTAARTGCHTMVDEFILSSTAPWNGIRMVNEEGDTALHVAVKYGHLDVVNSLVQRDIGLLYIRNNHHESPLYLAVERGFFHIVAQILSVCPTCSHLGSKDMTALHAAVVRNHQGFEYSSSPSKPPLKTLLWNSTRELSSRLFRKASRRHANPEHETTIGPALVSLEELRKDFINLFFKLCKCLLGTASDQTDNIMKELLEKKRDMAVTETDIFKRTPLHYAAQLGHLAATRKLLERDSSVAYLRDEEGSSALHIAAKKGYINIMEEIIKNCPCAFHLVDNKGLTILHVAAKFGKYKVVEYILKDQECKTLINETDNKGNTAMHLAAIYGHYRSVWILAGDHRVDKRAANKEYLKAIDIVQSNVDLGYVKKSMIMWRLEHHGARQSVDRVFIGESTDQKSSGIELDQLREDLRDRNNEVVKKKEISTKYLKDVSHIHLLVSTLIATVTFAAGLSLPGGYNEDGPNKSETVLSAKTAIETFMITDAIAFYCSTAAVFLHFFASLEQSYHLLRRFIKFAALLTYISILAIVIAFASGIYAVLPGSSPTSTTSIVLGALFLSFCIFGIL